ncbi:MAG TPA: methyltransferase domain-containing protein [Candidatus Binatia bacterium]|nr:methyltransferase domain-containing protein [Candidatus Binatia bacterium]
MSFEVAAEAYDRFMGRFSRLLAPQMADLANIAPGMRALDVGCGTGALTAVLVDRLGTANVAGIDPSESFVAAARERFPEVRIEHGSAEALPFGDRAFDAALAQLVVHFMTDPVGGIREMARVTRPGGVVAACVWDHAGGTGPLGLFWRAVSDLRPGSVDESRLPGARAGHLVEIFQQAGLTNIEASTVAADLEMATFDAYFEPFTRGVGPAGAYVQALDPPERERLREHARALAGPEPFTIKARAWAARGVVPAT